MMASPNPIGPATDAELLIAAARCAQIVAAWGWVENLVNAGRPWPAYLSGKNFGASALPWPVIPVIHFMSPENNPLCVGLPLKKFLVFLGS